MKRQLENKMASVASSRPVRKSTLMVRNRRGMGGLALPDVVQALLRESILLWDVEDGAYIVVDGEKFESR